MELINYITYKGLKMQYAMVPMIKITLPGIWLTFKPAAPPTLGRAATRHNTAKPQKPRTMLKCTILTCCIIK